MDFNLYMDILSVDSTSGREASLAQMLSERLKTASNTLEINEVGDGTVNLFFSWGNPEVVFCTHMDTVPPYIAPELIDTPDGPAVRGRGSCDAKGQIAAMAAACSELEKRGETGFGLLLLAGEETGSWGAKAFDRIHKGGKVVIVGEPTDNCMVSASKGTKAFEITIKGEAFHSGYPEHGASAVERFVDFMEWLRSVDIPEDSRLGKTTWNVGKLHSDNPQNILSAELSFRLYFRTSFASDKMVAEMIPAKAAQWPWMEVRSFGGDSPMEYMTLEGFPTKTVSFGSDAPHLTKFSRRILCGAGSILVAHRDEEQLLLSEIEKAASNYIQMFDRIMKL